METCSTNSELAMLYSRIQALELRVHELETKGTEEEANEGEGELGPEPPADLHGQQYFWDTGEGS